MPSRTGDFAKAVYLKNKFNLTINKGINIVFLEKYINLFSLMLITSVGLVFYGNAQNDLIFSIILFFILLTFSPILFFHFFRNKIEKYSSKEKNKYKKIIFHFFSEAINYLYEQKNNIRRICYYIFLSLLLWLFHMGQFFFMFKSLGSSISIFDVFRLVPIAIIIGLIPITILGIGTRDSALIYLFSPYESLSLIAVVGLFASVRYIIPGILGIPFVYNSFSYKNNEKL